MITDVGAFQDALAASSLPPVRSGRHDIPEFAASVVANDLGPVRLIELATPAGERFRDARTARAVDEELWQIDLMLRGRARVEQGPGTAYLEPTDLILIDPARPIRFASTASTHVTMLVPRRELRLRPADAARLAGVRIRGDGGPGALVSSLVRDLVRSLTGLHADRGAAAVTELVSAAFSAQLGDVPIGSDEVIRARVLGYIEARLADRDLTPAGIAAAHHISLRQLHKLFEDLPLTVAALIRRRRLERCHADLAGGNRTVTAVASHWGFADPAHFSRLFKSTFGFNAVTLTAGNRARIVNDAAARRDQDGAVQTLER